MQFSDFTREISGDIIIFKNISPILNVGKINYYTDNVSGDFSKKEFRWSFDKSYWSSWETLNQGNLSNTLVNEKPYLYLEIRYLLSSADSGTVTTFKINYTQSLVSTVSVVTVATPPIIPRSQDSITISGVIHSQFSDFVRTMSGDTITLKNNLPILNVQIIKYYKDNAYGDFSKKEFRWSFDKSYWSSWETLNQGNVTNLDVKSNSYLYLEIRYVLSDISYGDVTFFNIVYDKISYTADVAAPTVIVEKRVETIEITNATTLNNFNGDYYLWRPNHKGEQSISTITGLTEILSNSVIVGAVNIGDGSAYVYAGTTNQELRFKSFIAAGAAVITEDVSTIIISLDPSFNYTASNLGSGDGLFAQKFEDNLEFKSLKPGSGKIVITQDSNQVYIDASFEEVYDYVDGSIVTTVDVVDTSLVTYVDGKINDVDISLNNIWIELDNDDVSLNNIWIELDALDASIAAFEANDVTFDYVDGSIVAAVDAVDSSLVIYADGKIVDVDSSFGLYETKVNLDTSFGLYETKVNLDSSFGDVYIEIDTKVDLIYIDGSLNNIRATYIPDVSLSTDFYWNSGLLEVSTAFEGATIAYVDGSLAIRDGSILWLFNNKVNKIDLDSSFGLYETKVNLDSSFGLYQTILNLDTSFELYETKVNLDSSFGIIWVKFGNVDISLNNIWTELNDLDTSFGLYETKLNINSSFGLYETKLSLDSSFGDIYVEVNQLDASIIRIDAYQLIQDDSIAAFEANDVTFAYVDGSIVTAVDAVDTSLVIYVDGKIVDVDSSFGLYETKVNLDSSFSLYETIVNLDSSFGDVYTELDLKAYKSDVDSSFGLYETKVNLDSSFALYETIVNLDSSFGDVYTELDLKVYKSDVDASFGLYETKLNIDTSFGLYETKLNLDSSFALYQTEINLDSSFGDVWTELDNIDISFGLYETKLNLDSSFGNVYTEIDTKADLIYVDGSLNNIRATYIPDSSLSTDFYWNSGLLEVSTAFEGATIAYVDGSLAIRDGSILWLFNNKVNKIDLDSSFGLYETKVNLDSSFNDVYNTKLDNTTDTFTGNLTIDGSLSIGDPSGNFNRTVNIIGDILINNQLFDTIDTGIYFGKTHFTENHWALDPSIIGETWVSSASSKFWNGVATSSNGKYISGVVDGGYIYISSDYGNTWTQKATSKNWEDVEMSSNGKYQSAVINSNYIYISSNYGETWTQKASSQIWMNITISSDGKYQSAVADGGYIYISSDYGNTWTSTSSIQDWQGISMSSDGKYQSAVVDGDYIYVSSDYGSSWVQKGILENWKDIAMSSDGKYQSATIFTDYIYVSSDYGETWTQKATSETWQQITMSADGKYQIATISSGFIYISFDYGNTWVQKATSEIWRGVATSSDGKIIIASVNNGNIYISKATSIFTGGKLDINNDRIINVAYPIDPSDAVNKNYVDASLGLKVNIDSSFALYETKVNLDSSFGLYQTFVNLDSSLNTIGVRIDNLDSSLDLYETKLNLDSSFGLYETKVNLDSSFGLYLPLTGGTLTGDVFFNANSYFNGNAYFDGSVFITDVETIDVSAAYIHLNTGLTGVPPANLQSGIVIGRGSYDPYVFIFDETGDTFRIGIALETSTGYLDVSTQAVATREDNPIDGGVVFWQDSSSIFITYDLVSDIDTSFGTVWTKFEYVDTSLNGIWTELNNIDTSFGLYETKLNLDTSFALYETKVNLDSSFGLYETKLNLDSSFGNVWTELDNIDISLNVIDVRIDNLDSSLDLYETKVNIDTSFGLYETKLNLDTSFGLYQTFINLDSSLNTIGVRIDNLDSSLDLYETKVNIDTSFGFYETKVNLDSSFGTVWTKFGYVDTSLNEIWTELDGLDTSLGDYVLKAGDTMTGDLIISDASVSITGNLVATTKSFLIKHPTKKGKQLQYGNLEGPEFAIYERGRIYNTNIIELPEYWPKLVDKNSITVQLTPNKPHIMYVKEIRDNKIKVGKIGIGKIDCFYTVYGERIDVGKLNVER